MGQARLRHVAHPHRGRRPVKVTFEFKADTLDNAMAWSRDEFLLFNGTNVFLYPEGQPFSFPATVKVRTESDWIVATGMTYGGAKDSYREGNYHDLVDMPFFVGTSTSTACRWTGSPCASPRTRRAASPGDAGRDLDPPPEDVAADDPGVRRQAVPQLHDHADRRLELQGASALEHQNSHVAVIDAARSASRSSPASTRTRSSTRGT